MEPLNPDSELESKLNDRKRGFLKRLYKVVANDEIDKKKRTLVEILADRHEEEVKTFYQDYDIIDDRDVNRRYAEEYLNQSLGISREELDVDNRYELLLVLYEHGYRDKLQSMVIRSELFEVKNEREFQIEETVDIDQVQQGVNEFLRKANIEEQHLDPIRITVDEDEQSVALDIHQEYGRKYRDTFEYREQPGDNEPGLNPSINGTSFYPLRHISVGVEPRESKTIITFSKARDKWEDTLSDLFSEVFGVDNLYDKLEEKQSPGVQEIEQETLDAVEDETTDTADTLQESVEQRAETAADRIDETERPEEEKEDLKQRVNTFRLVGYSISNDQATSTDEFTIIAEDLDDVFGTIEGIELSFEDYLEKAEEDNTQLIFKIQNELVQLTAGDWEPLRGRRIAAGNKEALDILLGDLHE